MTVTFEGEPDAPGATPLTLDDLNGLIPNWVTTRAELNEVEQTNIEAATRWAFLGRKPMSTVPGLLTARFSDRLHRRMFGDVWSWAGQRRTQKANIGVDPPEIAVAMKLALDDAVYWHLHKVFAPDEIAVRIHHRLVSVHPYPNGNGRHTRLLADLYLHLTQQPRLTWGGGSPLNSAGLDRTRYIDTLVAATAGDIGPLVKFATS